MRSLMRGARAILLYARTVGRRGEFAVRTALGASRGWILPQLFIEALTLTVRGAIAGLVVSGVALQPIEWPAHANGGFPFWIRYTLSPASVPLTASPLPSSPP